MEATFLLIDAFTWVKADILRKLVAADHSVRNNPSGNGRLAGTLFLKWMVQAPMPCRQTFTSFRQATIP